MPKPRGGSGEMNLTGKRLKQLRTQRNLSRRDLAYAPQRRGLDLDKNAITRIEINKRYVTDPEIQGLAAYFGVSCDYSLEAGRNRREPPEGKAVRGRLPFAWDSPSMSGRRER